MPSTAGQAGSPGWLSRAVGEAAFAGVAGAVGAAEERAGGLHAVADDLAPAVRTDWGQSVDRALEAVERVSVTRHADLECLVVVVAADVTARHGHASFAGLPRFARGCRQ